MARVSISKAWDDTRAVFARDGRLLVAVVLALVVLPTVVVGLIVPSDPTAGEAYHPLLQLIAALIGMIGQLALIRLAIGPATTVGAAIGHGARRFPALLGAMVLLLLLFALVLIPIALLFALTGAIDITDPSKPLSGPTAGIILLFVIAAVALSVKFMLTSPVASAEAAGPLTILKRSWSLTSGNYWKLLGVVLLLLVTAIVIMTAAGAVGGIVGRLISPDLEPFALGTLALALFTGIGQGVFTMLSVLMVAHIYLQLAGPRSDQVAEVFN